MTTIETRRTNWIVNAVDQGLVYRIWQQFDGMRWFQRHEWKLADGSIRMDDWIRGAAGWCPAAAQVSA